MKNKEYEYRVIEKYKQFPSTSETSGYHSISGILQEALNDSEFRKLDLYHIIETDVYFILIYER